MTEELETFDEINDESLGESLDQEIDQAPPTPPSISLDALFGPEESMSYAERDNPRPIVNQIDVNAKSKMSMFDLARSANMHELRDRANALGAESYEADDFDPKAVLARKIMLAADFAERLQTPTVGPSPEQVEDARSPVSEAIEDLSNAEFEELVASVHGDTYGMSKAVKALRRQIMTPKED